MAVVRMVPGVTPAFVYSVSSLVSLLPSFSSFRQFEDERKGGGRSSARGIPEEESRISESGLSLPRSNYYTRQNGDSNDPQGGKSKRGVKQTRDRLLRRRFIQEGIKLRSHCFYVIQKTVRRHCVSSLHDMTLLSHWPFKNCLQRCSYMPCTCLRRIRR